MNEKRHPPALRLDETGVGVALGVEDDFRLASVIPPVRTFGFLVRLPVFNFRTMGGSERMVEREEVAERIAGCSTSSWRCAGTTPIVRGKGGLARPVRCRRAEGLFRDPAASVVLQP